MLNLGSIKLLKMLIPECVLYTNYFFLKFCSLKYQGAYYIQIITIAHTCKMLQAWVIYEDLAIYAERQVC